MTRQEFKIWFEGFLSGASDRSIEQKREEIARRMPAGMETDEYEMVHRRATGWHIRADAQASAAALWNAKAQAQSEAAVISVPLLGTIGERPKRAEAVSSVA